MSYKIIEEFSHSDICSDPDNQNKAKVCVFVGFDAKGDKMYDLHERRVRNGNLTTLLRLFRKSEFGARFREAEHSNTHTMSRTPPGPSRPYKGSTPGGYIVMMWTQARWRYT